MKSGPNRGARARDDTKFRYNLSHAIYGSFPSCATDTTPAEPSRAISPHLASKAPSIPKPSLPSVPVDFITTANNDDDVDKTTPTWLSPQRSSPSHADKMDNIHQSVCLNLTAPCEPSTSESELWILPELDDCDADSVSASSSSSSTTSTPPPSNGEKQYSLLVSHATKAKSHLHHLRARLLQGDYDAWDLFVATCTSVSSQDRKDLAVQQNLHHHSEERLDEEFDLVVLSAVRASC